jgi:lysyl-tRNA synthetase class II
MANIDEIRQTRLEKLEKLKKLGIDPYPAKVPQDFPLDFLKKNFQKLSEEGDNISIAGRVMAKKGEKMIFLKISDLSDSIDAVVFPKVYEEFQDILIPESCIVIKGTFSLRNGEKSILIDKVKALE